MAPNTLKLYEKPVFINSLLLCVNLGLFIFKIVFGIFSRSLFIIDFYDFYGIHY